MVSYRASMVGIHSCIRPSTRQWQPTSV
jgi:hypothetical protein